MSASTGDDSSRAPQVVIFGAGIAGLTAAHELAERGFEVDVYEAEPPSPWDDVATGARCGIGGMARTQWARTLRRFGTSAPQMEMAEPIELLPDIAIRPRPAEPPDGAAGRDDGPDEDEISVTSQMPRFERLLTDAVAWTGEGRGAAFRLHRKLEAVSEQIRKKLPEGDIEVRGYCDKTLAPQAFDYTAAYLSANQGDPKVVKRLAQRPDLYFAWQIALGLERRGVDPKRLRLRAMGLGKRDDWNAPTRERNFVRLVVQEDWVPGEHGFRFFPAFYRNLFDTMKRTPIATEAPQFRRGSVYLESARTVLDNIIPTEIMGMATAEHPEPFGFRRRAVRSLEEVFEQGIGMLKAMQFPIADLQRFQMKLFKYMTSCSSRRQAEHENQTWWEFLEAEKFSESFRRYLDSTAEALVAMNARKSDARTYGNISVQMLQDQLSSGERVDGTLNGPTSVAWFNHWRRYLQHQGVRFHRGKLERFEWFEGRPWAVVDRRGSNVTQRVIGRDYFILALPVMEAARIAKCVRDQTQEKASPHAPPPLSEDFRRLCEMNWGDPSRADPGGSLDHMAGVQFFFDGDVRLLNGHLIYPDAPWRLSAVGQPQFWRAKRGWWSGYRGILSVDISNWHNAGSIGGRTIGEAWGMTKQEIAAETWRQVCASGGPPLTSGGRVDSRDLPTPTYYHIDQNICWSDPGKDGRPVRNRSPLLINCAHEFPRRPGMPGAYSLSYDCIALAGTYMQTYTRLTTMESANESARHAVNAILRQEKWNSEELCSVFDPEDHEPPDLRQLRRLDEKLYALHLPHFTDILDLAEVPRAVLRGDADLTSLGLAEQIKRMTDGASTT